MTTPNLKARLDEISDRYTKGTVLGGHLVENGHAQHLFENDIPFLLAIARAAVELAEAYDHFHIPAIPENAPSRCKMCAAQRAFRAAADTASEGT